MKQIKLIILSLCLVLNFNYCAFADKYNFYFPDSSMDDNSDGIPNADEQKVKIINTSTYTVYDGTLSGYYALEYSNLASTLTNLNPSSDYESSLDYMGSNQEVLDFAGSVLTIRENSVLQMNDNNGGDSYVYDRVTKVDVTNGAVASEILIASSQEAYDAAIAAGHTAMLAESEISRSGAGYKTLTSFSPNITNSVSATSNVLSKGGFTTEQITNADGTVIFREESDGTIHVGENSIVLADETVSASGNDEIYSSSGKLQLGNNSNHVTEVKGSLRVQDPKVETDAANRRYVDGIGASALASISSLTAIPEGNGVGLGSGFINGQSALALGAQSVLENGMNINFSSAYNSTVGSYTVTTGVGFSF